MPRFSTFALLLAAYLILARPAMVANSDRAALHPDESFAQLSGRTLTGKVLDLPAAASGKTASVAFSFSQAAGKDARLWNERLSREFPNAVVVYNVIVLESIPKLFRGKAVAGIKRSMPAPVQDRTMILYRDEQLSKQRLAVSDTDRAYVVLVGPEGQVRWRNTTRFAENEYLKLVEALRTHGVFRR